MSWTAILSGSMHVIIFSLYKEMAFFRNPPLAWGQVRVNRHMA